VFQHGLFKEQIGVLPTIQSVTFGEEENYIGDLDG